jgi:MFS superfamily sulfate permease-like transporter
VLIFASQFHVMVDDAPKGSGLQNLASIPAAMLKGIDIPTLAPREERQFRTRALRDLGELHRRQTALATRLAELHPAHPEDPTLETGHAAHVEGIADDVTALAAEQELILTRLREITVQLEGFSPASNGDRSARIQAAAAAALEAGHEALDDLKAGQAGPAVATQRHAVDAVAGFQVQLKNHSLAAQIGLLTILVILAWQALVPKPLRIVPAPLVAIVAATAVAIAVCLPVLYVEVPDNPLRDLHTPTLGLIQDAAWGGIVQMAAIIAVVASAETLLCCVAVDQLHEGPRTKFDRELVAQGVGNMTCGLLGALPMTGVIVRSAANVQAGARTRASAFLHGFWLLVFVSALSFVLRMVPTAALAAMLVYTGYKLINPKVVKELWQYGKGEVAIYFATVAVIVGKDLLAGVITGVVLSGVKLLYTFSHLKIRLLPEESGRRATLSLSGSATFLRLPKLAACLEQIPANTELHVDMTHLDYIDHACLDLLMTWARQHTATGGKLVMDWDSMHAKFRQESKKQAAPEPLRQTA